MKSLKSILIIIILFSFLEPDYFQSIEILHYIFILIRVLAIYLGLLFIIKTRQILYVTFLVFLFFCFFAFSTYLNKGDLLGFASYTVNFFGFVMWLEIILKNSPIKGLSILNFVYSSLVYANLVFFLIFPEGYISYDTSSGTGLRYFLGNYNQFGSVLIPAVVINVIYSLVKFKRIRISTILLITTVCFTLIYFWSATSLAGIFLIIIYLIFIHRGIFRYLVNNKTVIITIVGLFVAIVVLNNLQMFSFVIENILGKDLTLSSRTIIWDRVKDMISVSPYFGHGYLEGGRYIYFNEVTQRDAHNTALQIILQSGYLGFLTFILPIILFFIRIRRFKSDRIVKFILFSFLVACIMMYFEVYRLNFIYLFVLLGIYSQNIILSRDKIKPNNNY